jgi:hypothetical protein
MWWSGAGTGIIQNCRVEKILTCRWWREQWTVTVRFRDAVGEAPGLTMAGYAGLRSANDLNPKDGMIILASG